MLIFIDSNILCSNYHMKGPSFEVAQRVGTIVLGQSNKVITSVEVDDIDDYNCPYCPY